DKFNMANTLQAKKRVRRNAKREDINKARRSRIRTYVKKVELAVEAGNADEAKVALKEAQPELMRGVTKGVLHKKTASRKVSRLAKRVKALG
ncbi:30S ribosomal protein S20, partial [Emcibacteraceae bacterium]|nr:30S ribosomal protein S20 [Emcibacteraceae bacterium]